MRRLQLIENVRDILAKAGFYLSERHYDRNISFDIIARKDDELLIIGVSVNADSSRIRNAKEIKILSDVLEGSPLFIAEKGGNRSLEKGVIYSRQGVPLLSLDTLHDMFIEGVPPYVFSAPGGFYVKIDSDLIKKARKERKISLNRLADIGGVSRKAIQKYEKGMGADLEVALKLQEFLGEDLILPLNPLDHTEESEYAMELLDNMSGFDKDIFEYLTSVGYRIVPTWKCPFEAITEDEKDVLLTGVGSEENTEIKKKAKIVSDISHITERDSVIFLKKRVTRVNLEGIPIIDKKELSSLSSKKDITDLLKERKGED
ncbi:MAG: transcriptional regulator [Candidatus Saliniplasma sp.]